MSTQGITFNAIKNFLQTAKHRQSKKSHCLGGCHVTLERPCNLSSHSVLEASEMATIPWPTVCASSSFVQHVRFSQVQPVISTHTELWHQSLSSHSKLAQRQEKKKKEKKKPNEQRREKKKRKKNHKAILQQRDCVCVYIFYMYNVQYTHSHAMVRRYRYNKTNTNKLFLPPPSSALGFNNAATVRAGLRVSQVAQGSYPLAGTLPHAHLA